MYHFYTDEESRNRISVAGLFTKPKGAEVGTLSISVARCGTLDRFRRDAGRSISEKRLLGKKGEEGKRIFKKIELEDCDGAIFVKTVEPVIQEIEAIYNAQYELYLQRKAACELDKQRRFEIREAAKAILEEQRKEERAILKAAKEERRAAKSARTAKVFVKDAFSSLGSDNNLQFP